MPEYVKKLAVHRTPKGLPARVLQKLRILRARAALKSAAGATVAQDALVAPLL